MNILECIRHHYGREARDKFEDVSDSHCSHSSVDRDISSTEAEEIAGGEPEIIEQSMEKDQIE